MDDTAHALLSLMAAVDLDSVVVVDVSPFCCDAFLVKRDRIRVLELPALKCTVRTSSPNALRRLSQLYACFES
jgi:hypothetical protein